MDSFQDLAKQRILKGATTCNYEFGKCCALDKKTKVKFGITIHHSGGLFDYIHIDVWDSIKAASLGGHR